MQDVGITRRARRRSRKVRAVMKRVVSMVVAIAIAVLGLFVVAPAQAAMQGPGYGTWSDAIGWQGAFVAPDGTLVYCFEPGRPNPSGVTTDGGVQSSVTSLSPFGNAVVSADNLARINYLVTTFGQGSPSNREASAVSFAVKALANPNAMYQSHGFPGPDNLPAYVSWVLTSTIGATEAAATGARAQELFNAAQSITAGPSTGGSGALTFDVDEANNYNGTVTMVGTPGSTGSITLTNGKFVANNSNTLAGAAQGVAYQVVGVPPTEDGAPYKISGTGTFSVGSGFAGNVHVWNTGSQQRTAGPGTTAVAQFNVAGEDPVVRGVQFLPVLSTTATTFVQPGENFADTLRFATTADSNGTNNSWYVSPTGKYAPVAAQGTVYGPFAEQPAESTEVPAGAPVAGTATVTTDLATGPTVEYTATSDSVADEAGYYTWVWTIDWNNQDVKSQTLIPGPSEGNEDQEPYYFQDAFGQLVESSVVPMDLSATTQVKSPEVALSGIAGDTAQIAANGVWFTEDGENIPVNAQWDAYYDTAETVAQVPASEIPATATHLGTVPVVLTGTGQVETPESLEEGGIQAPAVGEGHIVWVFSIDDAANGGMVQDFSDDYGVPTEIQMIAQPEVTTQAQPGVKPGESITDTAIVDGTLPAPGAELAFEAYKVPMIQNEDGTWSPDFPETDADGNPITWEPNDLSWVCTDENLVFSNVGAGQIITETGSYTSPEVTDTEGGKYLWVESLHTVPGTEGEDSQLIAEGICGLPSETTYVVDVTTKAQTDDKDSATPNIKDTAVLTGYVPENGTVTFEAFRGKAGQGATCTEATKVWTSEPVSLVGGYYPDGLEVESGTYAVPASGDDTTIYFIETTRDAEGRIVSQGECGEPDESVNINASKLAVTGGGDIALPLWIGGGVLAAGLMVIVAAQIRRRRESVASE